MLIHTSTNGNTNANALDCLLLLVVVNLASLARLCPALAAHTVVPDQRLDADPSRFVVDRRQSEE